MATLLSREDYERLQGRDFSSDAELRAAIDGTSDAETIAGELAAAHGCGVSLGTGSIPPLRLGVLPLLEMVASPYIRESAAEASVGDMMLLLYLLAHGEKSDIARLVASSYRARIAVERTEALAKATPEHYDAYLTHLARAESILASLDVLALADFTARYGHPSVEETGLAISRTLSEGLQGLIAASAKSGGEKKTATPIPAADSTYPG